MSDLEKPLNIFQRVNAVRLGIDYIKKDKSVSTGNNNSYKAVTHDMVTAMVRDHMVKHGIISYPVLVESTSMPFEVDKDMVRSKQFRYEATYDFHFVNADIPEDKLTIRIQAHAMDNADKAPGKALSYAKKYAVLKLFEIETGEDDESRVPDELDITSHVEAIMKSENNESLKAAFTLAYKYAEAARNTNAMKEIIAAKERRKAVLAKVAA